MSSKVLAAVQSRPDVAPFAYIVGQWVWVEFAKKPSGDTAGWLRSQGFRFNGRRQLWQHSCGYRCKRSSRDPRAFYGVERIEEERKAS